MLTTEPETHEVHLGACTDQVAHSRPPVSALVLLHAPNRVDLAGSFVRSDIYGLSI